jgi:hypothetical protein
MKKQLKNLFAIILLLVIATACEKLIEPTPQFSANNAAFTLTAPATTTISAPAADSLKAAVTFTWNDPNLPLGLAKTKFTLIFDKAGNNFLNPTTKEFTGVLSGVLLGKEVNGIALKYGGNFTTPANLDLRIVASLPNNNASVISNTIKVTFTPFSDLKLTSSSSNVTITLAGKDQEAIKLTWSTAFNGLSSVKSYSFEFAKGGTNFANATKTAVTTFSKSYSQFDLNALVLASGVAGGADGSIDFRIKCENEYGVSLYSNVVTVTVKTFIFAPDNLFIVGGATPNGWANPTVSSQQLKKLSFGVFQINLKLTAGEKYLLLPVNGSWDVKYGSNATGTGTTGDLVLGGSDIPAPSSTNFYSITIDFNTNKYTLKAFPSSLYLTGEGIKGWNWDAGNPASLTKIGDGLYSGDVVFRAGAFRFFAQADWGPDSFNYPYFSKVDAIFENANDGDKNFKFIGTPGTFKVTVDFNNNSVNIGDPKLYMTGAALNGWSWDAGKPVTFTVVSYNVFEASANFKNGETFRFFAQPDWNPTSYNYPYFSVVSSLFENANDDDKNLRYIGPTGAVKVRVDLNTKVVTAEDNNPKLYMTGAALNGWSWDTGKPVKLTFVSTNIYEATATFTSGETFRFFGQADWGPVSYNYPYFTSVDPKFSNAADGDSNFRYVGTTGSVKIRVDLSAKTVTVL